VERVFGVDEPRVIAGGSWPRRLQRVELVNASYHDRVVVDETVRPQQVPARAVIGSQQVPGRAAAGRQHAHDAAGSQQVPARAVAGRQQGVIEVVVLGAVVVVDQRQRVEVWTARQIRQPQRRPRPVCIWPYTAKHAQQLQQLDENEIETIMYDKIRDAILTCAQKLTQVSLINRTEPKLKSVKKRN